MRPKCFDDLSEELLKKVASYLDDIHDHVYLAFIKRHMLVLFSTTRGDVSF